MPTAGAGARSTDADWPFDAACIFTSGPVRDGSWPALPAGVGSKYGDVWERWERGDEMRSSRGQRRNYFRPASATVAGGAVSRGRGRGYIMYASLHGTSTEQAEATAAGVAYM